jgi:hypothetical protein
MDSDRSRTHYVQTYRIRKRKREKERENVCMITLRPVDLGQRVIYERREKEREKIHIVPSVSIHSCSRSSNLLEVTIYICTCYYNQQQQQHFFNKIQ